MSIWISLAALAGCGLYFAIGCYLTALHLRVSDAGEARRAAREEARDLRKRAEDDIALLLGTCVDYHNTLCRACVMDPVTPKSEVQRIYQKYKLKDQLSTRSLFGEMPRRSR